MTIGWKSTGLFALGLTAALAAAPAAAKTGNLRYLCYADANECDVASDLLDRFEKANPAIKVTVDKVGSVSYTHLDVYKRQQLFSALSSTPTRMQDSGTRTDCSRASR